MKFLRGFVSLVLIFSTLFAITASTVFASGATWTDQTTGTGASGLQWQSITSSADGTKLAATVSNGSIYTSINSGATWATSTAPVENWNSITSSSDGTKLAAVVGGGDIHTSTNGGATSATSTAPVKKWNSITSSSDGTRLAASQDPGTSLPPRMAEPRGPTKRDWVHWLHLASRHRPTAQNWPSTAAILPATSISPAMGERHGSIKLVQERGFGQV